MARSLTRKLKGSTGRAKAKEKLAMLHERIANVRKDALHKLSTDLTRRFQTIAIEDLNVKGMIKNRCLARSVSDMGFYELRRQLTYKGDRRGCNLVIADRWFPSSKTCSSCGYVLDALPLATRQWICTGCGSLHDRDRNAAINLRDIAVSSTVTACGGEGTGFARKREVKPAPAKQEFDSVSQFRLAAHKFEGTE
ncbi:transposase [Massilia sp. H-1]|nr:transposase [Massilia sp. H-1]